MKLLRGITTLLALVTISTQGYAKGSTSRTSYSSSTSTTTYTRPVTSSYSSRSSYDSPSHAVPASSGYSSYSSWSSSSGHGGGGGSTPGFVMPSSSGGTKTSSHKTTTYSSSSGSAGNTDGHNAGFVTPSSSYSNSATKGASNVGHSGSSTHDRYSSSMDDSATSFTSGGRGDAGGISPSNGYANYGMSKGATSNAGFVTPSSIYTNSASKGASGYAGSSTHDRYSSSVDDSATSFTSGGRGGIDAGGLTPSTGYTNYGVSKGTSNTGFVNPGSHSTVTKYSSSTTSTKNGGGGVDDGLVTPSTGYGSKTTNTAGFVVPPAPALPPSDFSYPSSSGQQNGKYLSTTTTTTITKGGAPYNQHVAPEHLTYVPYSSQSSYQTNTAYGNANSISNGAGATTYNVDKSKTKFNIAAPVFIPTSGYSFSSNGHRTYYNTQYIYRETSRSIGRGVGDSAEEQEMVGRITAGGQEGTKPVILYEHTDHTGRGLVLSVPRGQCLDVPSDFNDLATSVNTYGGCFWLCEHSNCYGSCKKFAPGVGDHKFVGDLYNDRITSVKQC